MIPVDRRWDIFVISVFGMWLPEGQNPGPLKAQCFLR